MSFRKLLFKLNTKYILNSIVSIILKQNCNIYGHLMNCHPFFVMSTFFMSKEIVIL